MNDTPSLAAEISSARPGGRKDKPLRVANAARDRRDWVTASEHYRLYLSKRPRAFAIWVQLGHTLKESGRHVEALIAYSHALALRPEDADLLLNVGHLHKIMAHRDHAIAFYRRSAEADGNLSATAELKMLGIEAPRVNQAPVEAYKETGWRPTKLIPFSVRLFRMIANPSRRVLIKGDTARNRQDWPAAVEFYQRYLRAKPNHFAIWVQLGHALKEMGKLQEALLVYETALRLDAHDADLLLHLGHLKERMRHHERATSYQRIAAASDHNLRPPTPPTPIQAELIVRPDDLRYATFLSSPNDRISEYFDVKFSVSDGNIKGCFSAHNLGFYPTNIVVIDQYGDTVSRCTPLVETDDNHSFITVKFVSELPLKYFDAGLIKLSILADDTDIFHTYHDFSVDGSLDILSPERYAGWLASPDALGRTISLEVICDDELVDVITCNLDREDVSLKIPGSKSQGFYSFFPSNDRADVGFSRLSFHLPGSPRELFGGPFIVAERPAIVEAARQISRAGLGGAQNDLSDGQRAILHAALRDFIQKARTEDQFSFARRYSRPARIDNDRNINIVIPVYKGISVTKRCIDSVIKYRNSETDRIVIINDHSPDDGMQEMLRRYLLEPNVFLIENENNLGFIKSVNSALRFLDSGDFVLLNSDTVIFERSLSELYEIAYASFDIGTITPLSNNATIFSYPHPNLRRDNLTDIGWSELAEICFKRNQGKLIDVPTGHGFCLYIKRDVLNYIGLLDEGFGRGYGEENDFCARAADMGFRNVAALGAFVEHRESISFADEKASLLAVNLPRLQTRYPEYTPAIMDFERRDDFRAGRWPLDATRLERASRNGARFALVISHELGGGTNRAILDIEKVIGYGGASKITLSCRADGYMMLSVESPDIRGIFSPHESAALFDLLSAANIEIVLAHQVLGFSADFVNRLSDWVLDKHSVFYAHDFYPACPRVTMIDAFGNFCAAAKAEACQRCLDLGGPHEASRITGISIEDHRRMFTQLLRSFKHVVAPSNNAARYLGVALPAVSATVIQHPTPHACYPAAPREGNYDEIILLGAIGQHKGSDKLLELSRRAMLSHPHLRFIVIGRTNLDSELLRCGNVSITGDYSAEQLESLVKRTNGRLALFLPIWPETFSYTLSEAVMMGLIPLVPDIGAPAERVRAAGFGVVFRFPIDVDDVLETISAVTCGKISFSINGAGPESFKYTEVAEETKKLYFPPDV